MQIYAIWIYENYGDTTTPTIKSAYLKSYTSDQTPTKSIIELSMDQAKEKQILDTLLNDSPPNKYHYYRIPSFSLSDKDALSYHSKGPIFKGCFSLIISEELTERQTTYLMRNIIAKGRDLTEIINNPEKFTKSYHHTTAELLKYDEPSNNDDEAKTVASFSRPCNLGFSCFGI